MTDSPLSTVELLAEGVELVAAAIVLPIGVVLITDGGPVAKTDPPGSMEGCISQRSSIETGTGSSHELRSAFARRQNGHTKPISTQQKRQFCWGDCIFTAVSRMRNTVFWSGGRRNSFGQELTTRHTLDRKRRAAFTTAIKKRVHADTTKASA